MDLKRTRGLYLVPPHGKLIATGVKSAVAKSQYVPGHRLFDLRGDWMLVSKVDGVGLGLGDMTLGEPMEVSLDEFDTKQTEHHVERVDRMRWWPEYETLWVYPVEAFNGYTKVLRVDVPAGVQTVMSNVRLENKSEKALTDVADGHFHALDSLDLQGSGSTEESQSHHHEVQNFGVQATEGHSHSISEDTRALFAAAQQRSRAGAQRKNGDTKHLSADSGSPATINGAKAAKPQLFIIFQRTWSHTPVRAYDLFIKAGSSKVWNFESPDNLLKGGKRRGVPLESSRKIEITDLEDKDRNIWSLSSGDKIQVKDGSQFNPTSGHRCTVRVLDTGKATLVGKKSDFRQYDFDGAKVKGLKDFELHDPEANVWLMRETAKGAEKETTMQEIIVLLDDEQLTGEKVYSKLSDANPALRGIKPPISLTQANLIASWADAMEAAENGPESPWGAAIAQFKELYRVEGDSWVERVKTEDKAKWSSTYISSLPDTAFLLIESGGEKKDSITRPLSLRHLPVRGKDGEVDSGHLRNALARMSQMKDKEGNSFPAATIDKLREKARKLLAESQKARGEGQGVGKPRQGDAGTGFCICTECDHIIKHGRGTPCNEVKCEKCGEPMRGATEAEIGVAGVQAGRVLTAATMAEIDASVKTEDAQDKVVIYGNEPSQRWEIYSDESDTKVGRRVRQDKVGLLQKLKNELHEFLSSLGEFVSWATYDDKPKDSEPEEFDIGTLLSVAGKKALEQGSTAFAFKALDGKTWWFQWTTNAFEDREGEIFTTKTIEDYVTRNENRDIKGEFWFWHTLGSKFGTVRLQAIVGRFLAQAGPFDDTAVGRAFKEFFSEYPYSHPDIAPEGWGTSHHYSYKSGDREDGVYNWFDIDESTVLPGRFASNPYSPMPQILQEVKQMNDEQRKAFAAVGGEEFVDLIMNIGRESTKKLEGEGVAFKEVTPEQDDKAGGNYVARIKEIAKSITDEGLKGQVEVFCAKLEEATPAAEKEADEAEKAKADVASLAGQLRMLAGKVGGDAGEKLATIAEEMAQASGKKEDAETPTETAGAEKAEPEPEVKVLTREEVADAMKAVVEVLRDEIKGITGATVTEITKALEPLVAEVKALKEADEVKVAQKAAETPAASLSFLLQSVIGSKATQVDVGSELAKSGPKETASLAANVTGIPFVDDFIGEVDQASQKPAGGN